MDVEEIARRIVDSAYRIHSTFGPELLESAYQACMVHDLSRQGLRVEREVRLPLEFDGLKLDAGYRLDMRVNGLVIVENKVVESVLPVHLAQLLTYLKLTGLTLGFLINWNVPKIKDGIKRVVLNHPSTPAANRATSPPRDTPPESKLNSSGCV